MNEYVKPKKGLAVKLGQMDFELAWQLQRRLGQARLAGQIPDLLLLLEHPHTYTIGKGGGEEHLLVEERGLNRQNIRLYRIDRGGDITYHGPGQLVGYPIFNLADHDRDIHRYLRNLEEILIRTVADYGFPARRIKGLTGVWVKDAKVAAIGVKISRWITGHGFAFNINTDLRFFDHIVPCGITDKGVTSLARLLGRTLDLDEVAGRVVAHTDDVFGLKLVQINRDQLEALLD